MVHCEEQESHGLSDEGSLKMSNCLGLIINGATSVPVASLSLHIPVSLLTSATITIKSLKIIIADCLVLNFKFPEALIYVYRVTIT